MKFEGCEGGNGIIYAGEVSRFVWSVGFLCVPVFFIYLYFDFGAVKLLQCVSHLSSSR